MGLLLTIDMPPDFSAIPSRHEIEAALQVIGILSEDAQPLDPVRKGYLILPSDGIFGTRDYMAAEDLLVNAGIAEREGSSLRLIEPVHFPGDPSLAAEILLFEILERIQPAWLPASVRGGTIQEEFIPKEAVEALSTFHENEGRRDGFLLAVGGLFDQEALAVLGRAGELAVVSACQDYLRTEDRENLASQVVRVSEFNDGLGFDVSSPNREGDTRHLEVKTAGQARTRPLVFLSRHEADVGAVDPAWRLVVCQQGEADAITIVGWTSMREIGHLLPLDGDHGHWATARLDLSDVIHDGLPLTGVRD